jgi:hypothetical protein
VASRAARVRRLPVAGSGRRRHDAGKTSAEESDPMDEIPDEKVKPGIKDLEGQPPLIPVDPDETIKRPTEEGEVILEVETERQFNG